jgi:hypothetical protein
MAKISHKKLLTKAGLNKGKALRVIASDDHVIDIEKEKSLPTRRGVNKQRGTMGAGGETTEAKRSNQAQGACLSP